MGQGGLGRKHFLECCRVDAVESRGNIMKDKEVFLHTQ